MSFLMACSLSGCAKKQEASVKEEVSEEVQEETVSIKENKILVVYFSCAGEQYEAGVIKEGNTAIVAKMICEGSNADRFEVKPVDDRYDLSYNDLTDVAKREQNDSARPDYLEDGMPDLSTYDVIFIGAPVWWGDWPMIMYSFFESNADALDGKTLVPFSTHAGSGLSGFDKKLASVFKKSQILKGLAVSGEKAQNDREGTKTKVTAWLDELNLK